MAPSAARDGENSMLVGSPVAKGLLHLPNRRIGLPQIVLDSNTGGLTLGRRGSFDLADPHEVGLVTSIVGWPGASRGSGGLSIFLPCSSRTQWPTAGRGTLSLSHALTKSTSEIPISAPAVRIGFAQTSS
jgi:hypothetical protein